MEDFSRCEKLRACDLYRTQLDKERERVKVYDALLERCHNKIISYSRLGGVRVSYTIPAFLFGLPIYNQQSAYEFVVSRLISEGFSVTRTHDYTLLVSWKADEHESASCDSGRFNYKGHFL